MKALKLILTLAVFSVLAIGAVSCQTIQSITGPKPVLEVTPPKTFLSPVLIKKPVTFTGSGFGPNEMVSIEMVLPPGVHVKGIKQGEDVGIAIGNTDAKGNFTAAMKPMATLNWFFQVGWTPLLRPNFKEARPLPPGKYKIKATGLDSDRLATAILEIIPPPKKK